MIGDSQLLKNCIAEWGWTKPKRDVLCLIFILISNRLRVQFSFSSSQYSREFVRTTIYIFVLGIFGYNILGIQTCKNIMKCNDSFM